MEKSGKFLKSACSGLFLCTVVLCGQNAHAVAIAESNAYLDWSTLSITGPGGAITIADQNQYTTYRAGYSTPNNVKMMSPLFTPNNWKTFDHFRENPAGVNYGYSFAKDNPQRTPDDFYANFYAKSDHVSFGDDPGQTYGGIAESTRWGSFTASQTGIYTFSISYVIFQQLFATTPYDGSEPPTPLNGWGYDYADAATNIQFAAGSGSSPNDADFLAYDATQAAAFNSSGPNTSTWQNFTADKTLTDKDGITYTGFLWNHEYADTLQLTLDIVAGQSVFFTSEIYNWGVATDYVSTLSPPDITAFEEVTTPEPCTVVLLGAGMAGLGFVRRRSKKVVA